MKSADVESKIDEEEERTAERTLLERLEQHGARARPGTPQRM